MNRADLGFGVIAAVKKMDMRSHQGDKEFYAEVIRNTIIMQTSINLRVL